ncbi:hypothetical protein NC653_018649 [Populus alba x Populus x berolinensis]|uniref:DM2 domain-containing protein n=1 Tax=Populus alba x Populus x berolinensis TaxID=444605 RepID=A0AAD6QGZ5_9ROSI|nr:hypothetical protein NC653_018649 [Populus alba x Populus x berolinensis]
MVPVSSASRIPCGCLKWPGQRNTLKQLWTHAREKNLQDPSDRRNINCDKPLQALFGVDSIKMFQMSYA